MKGINFNSIDLLDDYKNASDVPENVLKALNLYSESHETMAENIEWLEENWNAVKAGYKSVSDWEEDMMNMMYPDGYDPDVDGSIIDDD